MSFGDDTLDPANLDDQRIWDARIHVERAREAAAVAEMKAVRENLRLADELLKAVVADV